LRQITFSNGFLNDDEESIPINDYDEIADTLSSTVLNSRYKCIGIIGDWGIGKTTLMKLIESKLNSNIIQWNDIANNESILQKLLSYLEKNTPIKFNSLESNTIQPTTSNISTIYNHYDIVIKYADQSIRITYTIKSKYNIYENIRKLFSKIPNKWTKKRLGDIFLLNRIVHYCRLKFFKYFKTYLKLNLFLNAELEKSGSLEKETLVKKIYELDKYCYLGNDTPTVNLSERRNITTIFFNTWKYEREEEKALVPLLKNIFYSLERNSDYVDFKKVFFRSIQHISKNLPDSNALLSVLRNVRYIHEYEKDTLYYDGLNKLESVMNESNLNNDTNNLIVIFIDDLDRCSPDKVTELFESVKILLDLPFITFVVGMNDSIIKQHIMQKYKDLGFKDEKLLEKFVLQYFDKIFQLKYFLPTWNKVALHNLISHVHNNYPGDKIIKNTIIERKNWITNFVSLNPRELKNFLRAFHFYCDYHKLLLRKQYKNPIDVNFEPRLLISQLERLLVMQFLRYDLGDRTKLFIESIRDPNFRSALFSLGYGTNLS
jgi:hypothetical protein